MKTELRENRKWGVGTRREEREHRESREECLTTELNMRSEDG